MNLFDYAVHLYHGNPAGFWFIAIIWTLIGIAIATDGRNWEDHK